MGDEETMKILQGYPIFFGVGADAVQIAETAKVEAADATMMAMVQSLYHEPKGFSATGSVTISEDAEETIAEIARQLNNSEVQMDVVPSVKRLPRKMKKAIRTGSRYRRDTRWKRKAAQWQKRNKLILIGNITTDGYGSYTFTGMAAK